MITVIRPEVDARLPGKKKPIAIKTRPALNRILLSDRPTFMFYVRHVNVSDIVAGMVFGIVIGIIGLQIQEPLFQWIFDLIGLPLW